MNCIDFRRIVDTGLHTTDEVFARHKRECLTCNAHAQRALQLDSHLRKAVRVPVPENLASRILLKQVFESAKRRSRRKRQILALAASVLLTASVVGVTSRYFSGPGLDEVVVALVDEAERTLPVGEPVSVSHIRSVLKSVGVGLGQDIGEVTFVGPCVVRGKVAGHVMLRGKTAPISVLLMPGERVSARALFVDGGHRGVLLPAKSGAIAIVAAPGEALEAIEVRVRSAVRWSA